MAKESASKMLLGVGFGITALALAFFSPLGTTTVSAGDSSTSPTVKWSLDAQLVVHDSEAASLGFKEAASSTVDAFAKKLTAKGVKAEKRALGTDEKGVVYGVTASGTAKVDAFRKLIYKDLKPEFNFLGGVTEMEITGPAAGSRNMVLVLESNLSTGYSWHVASDSGMAQSLPHEFEKHTLGYGVSERQTLRLTPSGSGSTIRLVYKRGWENSTPTRQVKLSLSSLPSKLDLSNPYAPTGKLSVPQGKINDAAFPKAKTALPTNYDWRDQGIVTDVRDQGECGSCFAFGTVGIMESSLVMNGLATRSAADLSEQYIVSCNKDTWNCDEGGFTAHKYHYDTLGKNQVAAGAVLESVKPYLGTNGSCTTNYNKAYALTGWEFITGAEDTIPTDDQIKKAIYAYGPVTAGVCAGTGWDNYRSGVFSTNETSQCDGSTNHQIILVGWNDDGGYWILRNSWGTSWGIDGYMHIKYGVSRVGEGTSWVTTSGSSTTATLTISKSGSGTVTSSPTGINCGATCSYAFTKGDAVTLTATAADGYTFTGWSGACTGTGTCAVTMSADRSVTATFTASASTATLTVTKQGTGSGTVSANGLTCTGNSCTGTYTLNTSVTITATPDSGSTVTWSGCSTNSGNACTVSMTANKTVTATFTSSASQCTYTISPKSRTFSTRGGWTQVMVIAKGARDCPSPTVTASDSWITASLQSFRRTRGTVSITVPANTGTSARSGTVAIDTQTFTVNQSGAPCTLTLSSERERLDSSAQSGSFTVNAPTGCAWEASVLSGSRWLSISSGASGTGTDTVTYYATENTTRRYRDGIIKASITGTRGKYKIFRVTQSR